VTLWVVVADLPSEDYPIVTDLSLASTPTQQGHLNTWRKKITLQCQLNKIHPMVTKYMYISVENKH
jgi:hypothetical protein